MTAHRISPPFFGGWLLASCLSLAACGGAQIAEGPALEPQAAPAENPAPAQVASSPPANTAPPAAVAAPVQVASDERSFVLEFDKKRVTPVTTVVWPPERGQDSLVWKSAASCTPIAVYKDRILCGICRDSDATVSIISATTGMMTWGLTIRLTSDNSRCMMTEDGRVLVSHRTGGAAYTFEPHELIAFDSKDGAFLGAFSFRGRIVSVAQSGYAFVQQESDKPAQAFAVDWKGNGHLLVELPAEDQVWVDTPRGELWLMRKSKKEETRFEGTQYKWDGTRIKTVDPAPYGYDRCPGFSSYADQSGELYCTRQDGARVFYQLADGGPLIEHSGTTGLILEDGDIIRYHFGFMTRHKPVRIGKSAVKVAN